MTSFLVVNGVISKAPEQIRQNETLTMGWGTSKRFQWYKGHNRKDVALANPDYVKDFDIYTDTSSKQMCTGISQGNRLIVFFNRKLSKTQQHYSMTKIEILVKVETQKDSKDMLVGQWILVITDHKIIPQTNLTLINHQQWSVPWWTRPVIRKWIQTSLLSPL